MSERGSAGLEWLFRFLLRREQVGVVCFRARNKTALATDTGAQGLPNPNTLNPFDRDARPHEAIVSRFNQAALAQIRCGEIARAHTLCRRAIELCRSVIAHGGPRWWAEGMIEPYINLGRIAALTGRTQEALAIYEDVYALSVYGTPLVIDRFVCRREDVGAAVARGPAVRLFESFRALAMARAYDRALAFVSRREAEVEAAGGSARPAGNMVIELRALAAMLAGASTKARQTLAHLAARSGDACSSAACAMLEAEALWLAGNADAADGRWSMAVDQLGGVETPPGDPCVLYLLGRIALGRAAAGLGGSTRDIARLALARAESCGDDVHTLRCAIVLSSLETFECRETRWREPLASLVERTDYRLEKAAALCALAGCERGGHRSATAAYVLASNIGSLEGSELARRIARCWFGSPRAADRLSAPDRARVLHGAYVASLEDGFRQLMRYQVSAPWSAVV